MGEEDFFGFLDGEVQFLKRVFELLAEDHEVGERVVELFVVGFHFCRGLVARGSNPRRVGG